ncbi:MAG: hypothetical protein ACLFUS_10190, partial [Candidatus Sumerlaeia bacterium]
MMKKIACMIAILLIASMALGADFKWQESQAIVTETGAIKWNPRPLVEDFSGQDLRYIDFEGGNDANDGTSPQSAWKHHPWDLDASGKSADCSGVKTYVFKRGVIYRGQMYADDSGTAEQPVRLTSSASWGEGPALLVGSVRLPDAWKRIDQSGVKAPKHLPDHDKVYVLDLGATSWWNDGKPGRNIANPDSFGGPGPQPQKVEAPFIGLFTIGDDLSADWKDWKHLARWPD